MSVEFPWEAAYSYCARCGGTGLLGKKSELMCSQCRGSGRYAPLVPDPPIAPVMVACGLCPWTAVHRGFGLTSEEIAAFYHGRLRQHAVDEHGEQFKTGTVEGRFTHTPEG